MAASAPLNRTVPELSKPAPIRLQLRKLEKIAYGRGLNSDVSIADAVGVDSTLYNRIRRLETAPGPAFIAGVLRAFPEWEFEDLFVVHEGEQVAV